MIFGVYPYCCISQQFILFYFWVVCHEWISSIFIHSPVEGHLGCFLVLMVKNRAAKIFVYRFCMNIGFHFTWVKTQECLCIFKSLSLTAIQKKKKNKQTKNIFYYPFWERQHVNFPFFCFLNNVYHNLLIKYYRFSCLWLSFSMSLSRI